MSGAIMNKVWGFLGMDPARDNEEEEEELENYDEKDVVEEEGEEQEDRRIWGRRNNKVVSMPQVQQVKMAICQPTNFEQAEDICDLLKEKKSIIINLEYVNKDVARRIVDVVSGAVHALDGHMQKVSNAIFLIAPYNYDISSDMVARDEIKNKLSVSWLRNGNN
jgi:cell division inhibitor SepF